MEFALVEGQRHRPEPKLAGTCPVCGNRMVSKCGTKVLWHWAHHTRRHCDPWWENETEWHRAWKGCFPEAWREQVHFDDKGEKHIADVKTPSGTVVEFQNSAMSPEELQARERFYGKMLWIVNGLPFIRQFYILDRLPPPEAEWTQDILFWPQYHNGYGRCFFRKSENPDRPLAYAGLVHDMDEIQAEIDRDYVGHHFLDWVRPRSVWFASSCPVYIDFGGDLLWQMQTYGDRRLPCVQAIRKKTQISHSGGEYRETGEIVQAAKRPRRSGCLAKGKDEIILRQIR